MINKANDYRQAKQLIIEIRKSIDNNDKTKFTEFLKKAFVNSSLFHGDTWINDNEEELNNQVIKAYAIGLNKFKLGAV